MGSKSAPTAPDPYATAAAQTQSNQQTAAYNQKLNMLDSYGPSGSVTYSPSANAPGGYAQTTTLSPTQQAIYNQQTSAQAGALGIANDQLSRVSSALGTSLKPSDYGSLTTSANGGQMAGAVSAPGLQSGFNSGQMVQGQVSQTPVQYGYGSGGSIQTGLGAQGPIATGYGSGGSIQGSVAPSGSIQTGLGAAGSQQAIGDAQKAAYGTATQYLTPQLQQQQEQLQSQLTSQGLNPNDAAYQNAMTLFNNQSNQAYQGAANAAVSAGQAEQNTLYNQSLSSGNFANAAQAQQYGQNLSSGSFANAAQAQQNTQNANAASFANSAGAQQFSQGLSAGNFANSAAGQQYTQNMGSANFANTAAQSNFSNQLAAAQQQNSQQAQAYNQAYQNATLGNTAQQQAYNQAAYSTSLPINELSSLLGLGQVSTPTGISYTPASAQSTDVGGIVNNSYANQLNAYKLNSAQTGNTLSGLFSLGSSLM